MPTHILIVDSELAIVELLAEYLRGRGWEVSTAGDGREARALLAAHRYDVLLTDLKLPDTDGLDLVRHASRQLPPVPGVVMAGYTTVDNVVRALRLGVADFLLKPFKLRDVHTLLETAISRGRRQRASAVLAKAVVFFSAAELAEDRAAALALTNLLADAVAALDGVTFVEVARGASPQVQLGTRSVEIGEWKLPGDHVLRVSPAAADIRPYVLAAERALRRGGF